MVLRLLAVDINLRFVIVQFFSHILTHLNCFVLCSPDSVAWRVRLALTYDIDCGILHKRVLG